MSQKSTGLDGLHEDLDSPQRTVSHGRRIQNKRFLRSLYEEWYEKIVRALPSASSRVLEVGAGGGFLRRQHPNVVTMDILPLPGLDLVGDAMSLPLRDQSVDAIVTVNVLHHLPDVKCFFYEAARTLQNGGVLTMIEPWNSAVSRWIYTYLHHEPFRPDSSSWSFTSSGPLSGANAALPWIIFDRDLETFRHHHPEWRRITLEPFMPLSYLISGGLRTTFGPPGFLYRPWRWLERTFLEGCSLLPMFCHITLQRNENRS